MATRKVLHKVAYEIESVENTYQEPNTLVPRTTFTILKKYEMVPDESITGDAFQDLPNQGMIAVDGELAGIIDVLTCAPLFEAAWGAEAAGVYTLPVGSNTKSLSMNALDGVKTKKFAGTHIKEITFSSDATGRLVYSAACVAYTLTRDDTAFPAMSVTPGTRILHRHAGSTNGYMRVAAQGAALDSGDNVGLADVEFGWAWNFDNDYDNTQQGTIDILSGKAGRPTAKLQFTVSRHDTNNYHSWMENATKLQAEFLYYASATAQIKIQVPNILITEVGDDDGDVAMVPVVCAVGRNGIAASYENSDMPFNSAIRGTLTDS